MRCVESIFPLFPALLFVFSVAADQPVTRLGGEQTLTEALVIPAPQRSLEVIGTPDPIEARMVGGTWKTPRANEESARPDFSGTTGTWRGGNSNGGNSDEENV